MKKICPSCKTKSNLILVKTAKSFLVGNQYQCRNCKAILAWDKLSHILSYLLPLLLITPTLIIKFIELTNKQTVNLYIVFGLLSLMLLIFGFYRRYLVVYKN